MCFNNSSRPSTTASFVPSTQFDHTNQLKDDPLQSRLLLQCACYSTGSAISTSHASDCYSAAAASENPDLPPLHMSHTVLIPFSTSHSHSAASCGQPQHPASFCEAACCRARCCGCAVAVTAATSAGGASCCQLLRAGGLAPLPQQHVENELPAHCAQREQVNVLVGKKQGRTRSR